MQHTRQPTGMEVQEMEYILWVGHAGCLPESPAQQAQAAMAAERRVRTALA